ncbi:hypothetical protein [Thermococcus thioreducens]|uniref:Uncharacterized protein n=1 Tax=Thermococcus thioreducens TaxID=277988 RepID=A0A0Q2QRK4_9EURY|nr:hypothetical protein [Thermococcus thioreducens]ASJ11641.1 hypothetical protein A3L14_01495 [Thermococcus thioreducens]KQH82621.1 hypothetical protein AMR53_04940 [Thermococcus thioreducens]SEW16415.1 hypothetical protein SAMN05216170_1983 [Thermococcus thioreducens]
MTEPIRDSVEVALELDEKEVYSHIAHESAEDIIRIISSLDAERAKLHGEVIYYRDDWDDLIRERIAKGKRHTAFDFYNPALLDIWEQKVKEIKEAKKRERMSYAAVGALIAAASVATAVLGQPYLILGLAVLPTVLLIRDSTREKLDLIYYELTQFFIDELKGLIEKHSLQPERYKFKIFSGDYFGVMTIKAGTGLFAVVNAEKPGSND